MALFCSPQVKQEMVAQARLLGDRSSPSTLLSSPEPSDRERFSLPADKERVGSTGKSVPSATTVAGIAVARELTKPETKAVAVLLELEAVIVEEAAKLLEAGSGTEGGVGKAASEDVGVVRSVMVRSGKSMRSMSEAGERAKAKPGRVDKTRKRASSCSDPSKQ